MNSLIDWAAQKPSLSDKLPSIWVRFFRLWLTVTIVISFIGSECNSLNSDLKLENLILENKKDNSNLKVIDFGTSRKVDPNEKLTRRIGTVCNQSLCSLTTWPQKCSINHTIRSVMCGLVVWSCIFFYVGTHHSMAMIWKSKDASTSGSLILIVCMVPISLAEDWGQISQDAKSLITKLLTYDPQ